MIIEVKVIPNSNKNELLEKNNKIVIKIKSPAEKGKANQALIRFLSKYYNVSKSSIKIIRGKRKRNKLIKIDLKDTK